MSHGEVLSSSASISTMRPSASASAASTIAAIASASRTFWGAVSSESADSVDMTDASPEASTRTSVSAPPSASSVTSAPPSRFRSIDTGSPSPAADAASIIATRSSAESVPRSDRSPPVLSAPALSPRESSSPGSSSRSADTDDVVSSSSASSAIASPTAMPPPARTATASTAPPAISRLRVRRRFGAGTAAGVPATASACPPGAGAGAAATTSVCSASAGRAEEVSGVVFLSSMLRWCRPVAEAGLKHPEAVFRMPRGARP